MILQRHTVLVRGIYSHLLNPDTSLLIHPNIPRLDVFQGSGENLHPDSLINNLRRKNTLFFFRLESLAVKRFSLDKPLFPFRILDETIEGIIMQRAACRVARGITGLPIRIADDPATDTYFLSRLCHHTIRRIMSHKKRLRDCKNVFGERAPGFRILKRSSAELVLCPFCPLEVCRSVYACDSHGVDYVVRMTGAVLYGIGILKVPDLTKI